MRGTASNPPLPYTPPTPPTSTTTGDGGEGRVCQNLEGTGERGARCTRQLLVMMGMVVWVGGPLYHPRRPPRPNLISQGPIPSNGLDLGEEEGVLRWGCHHHLLL